MCLGIFNKPKIIVILILLLIIINVDTKMLYVYNMIQFKNFWIVQCLYYIILMPAI